MEQEQLGQRDAVTWGEQLVARIARINGWPVEDEVDPNEALKTMRECMSSACSTNDEEIKEEALTNMMDAFAALDAWITGGGFLPSEWKGVTQP